MDSAVNTFSSSFQDRFFSEDISHLLTDEAEVISSESAVPEQNRTEQNRTEQNRTEQNRTEQNRMNPQSPKATICRR